MSDIVDLRDALQRAEKATAPALVPLDVEAVARWLLAEFAYQDLHDESKAWWQERAEEFVATFGVPAPDAEALRLIEELRRPHTVIEDDCWYSCPKSDECCNDSASGCTCGADDHNAKVDELLARLRGEGAGK